ncbi:phytoene/squalene synthase family protein [Marinilactibacillus sp. Marseille-P9653]|uniref:phytoene/squalene synthase family protein n=1 Tax=Marinilactibacillus sp. Marseille-P9653 TaxID=2866583 RepID=UPI001CE42232|nr:phytoene/squalene synthase family protein [Marinilactibacillus sp. Marseille-P9653]
MFNIKLDTYCLKFILCRLSNPFRGGSEIEKGKREQTSLEKDYDYCEEIIKEHSKSFYFAFSRLPEEKAKAVYAIYAFCRQADDSIDEADSSKEQQKALLSIKKMLEQFEKGEDSDHPVWRALRDVFNRFDMSLKPFYDQLEGQTMDYNFKQPETLTDLEKYSYFVAGSVGLMLLPILATNHHQELKETAISLGVAMQITNILRDIGEDQKEINRIYLPVELMKEAGYTYDDLKSQVINPSFISMWETLASRSETLYKIVKQDLNKFDSDSQLPVLLSANVYAEILATVRKNGYDCFNQRNKTSFIRKLSIYKNTRKTLKAYK